MPITPFLTGQSFEPGQIAVMSAAFADTCKALGLSQPEHPGDIARGQYVVGLGKRGFKNRTVIHLLTLEEFRSHRQNRPK
jgi:hypothetical protein